MIRLMSESFFPFAIKKMSSISGCKLYKLREKLSALVEGQRTMNYEQLNVNFAKLG